MLLLKTQAASFPNTISSHFTWCTHICICRCVHVSTDIHKFMLSTKGQRGYGQQKLVPLELPLLFVNDTNRSFVSTPSLSYITPLPLSFLYFLSLLVKDFFLPLPPSVLIPFVSLFIYCSPSIHPSSSPSFPFPLLARWLLYHWDGCGIKDATLFFFSSIAPSQPLSFSPV